MPKKILIAEDNKKNRLLITDILKYFGYEVIEAVNGAEGIEMAKAHMPDLIIMDIQMPVMNGFEAIKALKNDPVTQYIKIIALTSFAMAEDREKVMKAGADDYISKPLNTRILPEIVKKYIG